MINDRLSLGQIEIFAAVAEAGSFSGAARALGRAQSAVTYAIQNLEAEAGVELFDRSAYRPVLSHAGRALLPRAQQILEDVAAFRAQARGIAGGLEPELSLVVEAMFPMPLLVEALSAFQVQFPTVQTRVQVETMGAVVQALVDGTADICLGIELDAQKDELASVRVAEVELVAVVGPHHPLAALEGRLSEETLREHVQLVLSDRTAAAADRDRGVIGVRTWRLADLGAKHAMLLAGLGWGSMPRHMVEADLAAGRLVQIRASYWDGQDQMPRLAILAAHLKTRRLGPAGTWLLARLSGRAE
jgi:DNA-binding transcriptional LysR family regulator